MTAGTFNMASFSHHIGQDSGEQLPQMLHSENSERYSEIDDIALKTEDKTL